MASRQRARNYRFLPKEMWQAGINAVKGMRSRLRKRRGGRLKGLIRLKDYSNRVGTNIVSSLAQKQRIRKSRVKSQKLGFEAIPENRLRAG